MFGQIHHFQIEMVGSLIDALPVAVAVVNPAGRIELVNAQAARLGLEAGKDPWGELPQPQFKSLVAEAVAAKQRVSPRGETWAQSRGGSKTAVSVCTPAAGAGDGRFRASGRRGGDARRIQRMLDTNGHARETAATSETSAKQKQKRRLLSAFSHELKSRHDFHTNGDLSIDRGHRHIIRYDAAANGTVDLSRAASDVARGLHGVPCGGNCHDGPARPGDTTGLRRLHRAGSGPEGSLRSNMPPNRSHRPPALCALRMIAVPTQRIVPRMAE